MIDIESDVFDTVAKAIRSAHSGVHIDSEYVESPARFPAVSIVEADNRVYERVRTLKIENAASVMYEINVYSNKASGKKSEAKAIANTADETMEAIGFTRTFREQIPNLKDATIYRIVCRYQAVIDSDFWIYQNQ